MCALANAEMTKEKWEKTVTLPSSEVILDMSGEWDVQSEGYGPFSWLGIKSDILTITQEGNTFTAIKQIGSKWVPKGAETIKGELSKDGFKAIYHYIGAKAMDGSFRWEESKWEIRENGNKVMLNTGDRVKATLTRK
ncbi:MAG: hypothetical protein ABFS32_23310 [Bacteroidota bacterium]